MRYLSLLFLQHYEWIRLFSSSSCYNINWTEKKLKFALEWNYLFIATTIWKILDNHLDGKQKGWKYILEALNSKKIIFTQAGRKHCAKVSSGIENWLIFYLDGFSFDFFFPFVFYRYKVVLPRRSSTTNCFMDYLPFYLFCPAKTNVHTMSNQCYWRSVPHLVTTTMHTIALFIRVTFHCCSISEARVFRKLQIQKREKMLSLVKKTKEWILNEFNEHLRLLCGGVNPEYWVLSDFNRHLPAFC